jgi:hypothetical protein
LSFLRTGARNFLAKCRVLFAKLDWFNVCATPEPNCVRRLLMQITKFAIKKRQIKISPYNDDYNGQVKSPPIDWPILTFWLTYFGIMFAVLCGLISA